jgi:uncharacterized protein (TIGR02757 family)
VSSRLSEKAKSSLDSLYRQFDRRRDIVDPVQRVHNFRKTQDREVVGFCAAALAFGRVTSVLQSIDALLAVMGDSPAQFVQQFDAAEHRRTIGSITHRWIKGQDLLALLLILRRMLVTSGSIETFFNEGYDADMPDIENALESFSSRALGMNLDSVYGRTTRRNVSYFFPRPSKGSACKRLNLYLRWMVRRDQHDLGAWTTVRSSQLVIPLDAHIIRVGQCLGLTSYRSPGWAMARDITNALRRFDPADPVKYDFSLCHMSMMDQCGFTTSRGDELCPLRGWCRPG